MNRSSIVVTGIIGTLAATSLTTLGQSEGLGRQQIAIAQAVERENALPNPRASEVLQQVALKARNGTTPLAIYPPGYFDWLQSLGDEPIYETLTFDPGVSALTPGDKANMVWIPPGTFIMGSPTNEIGHPIFWDETQHQVTITRGYYFGKYDVTQGEYLAIIGTNPSWINGVRIPGQGGHPPGGDFGTDLNRPVEMVSWNDATNYCFLLTQQEITAGRISPDWTYRLPTEAEWEYACRAGTQTAFSFGNSIHGGMANFDTHYEYDSSIGDMYIVNPVIESLNRTTTVGSYAPNPWGLYDMHGNVWNWCSTWLDSHSTNTIIDPQGPATGTSRVCKGGRFFFSGSVCRSASQQYSEPSGRSPGGGFRIVLAPAVQPWTQIATNRSPQLDLKNIGIRPLWKDHLVVITHGRIPLEDDPQESTAWVDSMSNAITGYLVSHSITNCEVRGVKWLEDAQKLWPQTCLENARQQGVSIGLQILEQGYTHVHFIAHSAGSGLIQSATDVIKAYDPSIVVHETFLDPFVGTDFSGTSAYGLHADWSDNYSTKDTGTLNNILPFTYNILENAYNVDVTQLDVAHRVVLDYWVSGNDMPCFTTESTHSWPIGFYSATIAGAGSEYEGFGFPLSEEGGNWSSALANYPTGNVSARILGTPDPADCRPALIRPIYSPTMADFESSPTLQSTTGIIEKHSGSSITEKTGSPVWLATFLTLSNIANTVSFGAEFQSQAGAQGVLTVYWDDEIIGSIDERGTRDGLDTYVFEFPSAPSNSLHMLGFRLDPFTNIQSVIVITNVMTTFSGMSEPFSLSLVGITNGSPMLQLNGQAGFEYRIQSSTNLVDWTAFAIVANTNGAVQFSDPNAANSDRRFYRAVTAH